MADTNNREVMESGRTPWTMKAEWQAEDKAYDSHSLPQALFSSSIMNIISQKDQHFQLQLHYF